MSMTALMFFIFFFFFFKQKTAYEIVPCDWSSDVCSSDLAGVALTELPVEDVAAVRRGCDNLAKHVENVRLFGLAPVVALNHFTGDTEAEAVLETCRGWGVPTEVSRGWAAGGAGTTDLAQTVLDVIKGADRTAFR